MLLVIDSSAIAVAPEPSGGFALKLSDIEGLSGIEVFIPVGIESATQFLNDIQQVMGDRKPRIDTFGPGDVPHVG